MKLPDSFFYFGYWHLYLIVELYYDVSTEIRSNVLF